jgi:transmembrane sensor
MSAQRGKQLLSEYIKGTADEGEQLLVEYWYAKRLFKNMQGAPLEAYDRIKQEIWVELDAKTVVKEEVVLHGFRLWPRVVVVAAAVAAVVFGVWFFNGESGVLKQVQDDVVVSDIAPGKNRAILTLANGKTINLSDAKTGVIIDANKLSYNDGTSVISSAARDLLNSTDKGSLAKGRDDVTITTPRGGTYQVTLPDGTRVWLNADSKLVFPSNFGKNGQRVVRLSGEGYFEVAKVYRKSSNPLSPQGGSLPGGENRLTKGERIPFIVQTDRQTVEVLGTHFNVNAYKDESNTKTTLLEGSVRVSEVAAPAAGEIIRESSSFTGTHELAKGSVAAARSGRPRNDVVGGNNVILKPNQQSVLINNNIKVQQVNPKEATAWKNGDFQFDEEKMSSIMKKLERWYNVEIQISKALADKEFTGKIARSRNISQVLSLMEETNRISFKIEGRRIIAIEK